jgi:lysophospholipase L1-like esterase
MAGKRTTAGLAWAVIAASLLPGTARAAGDDAQWVGSWAASPQVVSGKATNPPEAILANKVLRQVVHLSVGGDRVRIRLDNTFGEKPLVVRSAKLGTDAAVTFGGQPDVTLTAGALVWSDPVPFQAPAGGDLTVTLALGDAPMTATGHALSVAASFLSDRSAATAPATGPAAKAGKRVLHWYVLDGVDVETKAPPAAVVTLGDSITDGAKSTNNANHRWPDVLADRLRADPTTAGIGVLNEGISGNRLTDNGSGPSTLARLDRDVIAQTSVRWVVLLEGINDIGTDRDAAAGDIVHRLELADTQIVTRCHTHGIKVYGATILPFVGAVYASPEKERNRQAVNQWMRTSGTFDAVVDLEAATRDPQQPDHLSAACDSGDHLHPADAGYRVMGEAVDLKLFAR